MDLINRLRLSVEKKKRLFILLRVAVFMGSLAVFVLGMLRIITISYWICGIALFFVLYTLLSLTKKEIKVLKWLGANSFMIYLIEGKLIAIWGSLEVLQKNIAVYLLSYTAAVVASVYLYRLGSLLYGRFRSFLELEPTESEIQKN